MTTADPAGAGRAGTRRPRRASIRSSELWAARQLLRNLTVRELKVRYKRSVLGFLWSLLNPLLLMGVFTVVFGVIFKASIEDFPIFFIVGYLPWSFFQASVQTATGVVVGSGSLVKKVYFPREVLPLSCVTSQLVHFALAEMVLLVVLAATGYNFFPYLPVALLATLLLVVFSAGMSLLFAALNTRFRDVQELSGILFLVWFYLTPVVYTPTLVPPRWRWVTNLNPLSHILELFRDAQYSLDWPRLSTIGAAALSALVALGLGAVVFSRMAADFAKEV